MGQPDRSEELYGAPWYPDFQCFVESITYDFISRTGTANLFGCTSMTGCIELFKRIDAQVQHIYTYDGGELDTGYHLCGEEWQASWPPARKAITPFNEWLTAVALTDDPVGDFIRDARGDSRFPTIESLDDLLRYLDRLPSACDAAKDAARQTWHRYKRSFDHL